MRLAVPSTPATEAASTKQTLRELDRRTATATSNAGAVGASARHSWHGSITATPGGSAVFITTATTDIDDGVATFSDGVLLLNQAGRWSLWFQYVSDSTVNGNSACSLGCTSAALAPWGPFYDSVRDERLRGGGYALAGKLTQSVSWTGVVTQAHVLSSIYPTVMWRSSTGGTNATGTWVLSAHFLGSTIDSGV